MKQWIPNQHGAWAFVLTPVIVGAIISGPQWTHLALLVGWLAAYCFNFYIGLTVKGWRRADRWTKYRSQQLVYGSVAAVSAGLLIWSQPPLLVLAPALLAVFAANLYFIRSKNERAWLNDLLGVVAAVVMGLVSLWLGAGELPGRSVQVIVAVGVYFAGTVWYVKTMIREKGKSGWLLLSKSWHLAYTIVAAMALPWFVLNALPAVIRAWTLPGRPLTPKQVGYIEIVLTLAAVAASVITVFAN